MRQNRLQGERVRDIAVFRHYLQRWAQTSCFGFFFSWIQSLLAESQTIPWYQALSVLINWSLSNGSSVCEKQLFSSVANYLVMKLVCAEGCGFSFLTLKKEIDLGFELAGLRNVIIITGYKLQNFSEEEYCPKRINREGRVVWWKRCQSGCLEPWVPIQPGIPAVDWCGPNLSPVWVGDLPLSRKRDTSWTFHPLQPMMLGSVYNHKNIMCRWGFLLILSEY